MSRRWTISRGNATAACLKSPTLKFLVNLSEYDRAGNKVHLPIRACSDCGDVFYAHDVNETSFFNSCPKCLKKSGARDDMRAREEWRQILLTHPWGQPLITATEKWLPRANVVLGNAKCSLDEFYEDRRREANDKKWAARRREAMRAEARS